MPELETQPYRPLHLIILSAPTPDTLTTMRKSLADRLKNGSAPGLPDAAFTLQVGRERFSHRMAAVCRDMGEAISALENPGSEVVFSISEERKNRGVLFVFGDPGEGGVRVEKALYERETAFREAVDACGETLKTRGEADPRDFIFSGREQPPELLLPVAFTVQYALARLWISWGVGSGGFTGSGAGELAAACLSGAVSPERALALSLAGDAGDDASGSDADARWKGAPEDALLLGIGGAAFRTSPGINGAPNRRDFVDHGKIDLRSLVYALGRLYCLGASVDWSRFHAGAPPYRVPLPGYPFEQLRGGRMAPPAPGDSTPEEKEDRRPAPETETVAPNGEVEKTVAAIWENLLQIDAIGVTDDLLSLGADSLLAMQFCSRVFKTLGVEMVSKQIFETPRIADLAAVIEEARDAETPGGEGAETILQKIDFIKDLSESETDRLLAELADGGV